MDTEVIQPLEGAAQRQQKIPEDFHGGDVKCDTDEENVSSKTFLHFYNLPLCPGLVTHNQLHCPLMATGGTAPVIFQKLSVQKTRRSLKKV